MEQNRLNKFLIKITVRAYRIPVFAGLLGWLFLHTKDPALTAIFFFIAICFDIVFMMLLELFDIMEVFQQALQSANKIHEMHELDIIEIKEKLNL
ncbi:MAG: hypothetical protein KAS32_26610 [Candidatus Peribacteraceae bacterium]|nr:hypothetical protein [Candidatus Peribacteraceae bacterium]